MAVNDYAQSQNVLAGNRIIAFFEDRDDAYAAISELRDRGFTTDQIGLMTGSNVRDDSSIAAHSTANATSNIRGDEGFWQKVKDFFTGDEHNESYDYNDSVSGMSWDQSRSEFYRGGIERGGALVSVTGDRLEVAREILERSGGDLRESGFESSITNRTSGLAGGDLDREQNLRADQDYRIQLRGEILRTYRERVQRGEVRLRKEVVTENQTVEVPVTREELVVERVAPTNASANAGEIGTDQEIRVPLSEEQVRVEKQPVVNEEVRVGKRAVQRNERVSDNVRHEELRVDKDGDVNVQGDDEVNRKKPAA